MRTLSLIALVACLSFYSCFSDYDLENLEVEWAPEVLVPLAHGTFVMDDIVNLIYDDSLYLQANDDSLLHIHYRQDSVYFKQAKELITIPDNFDIATKTFILGDIPLEDYKFKAHHSLQQLLTSEYEMDATYVNSLHGTEFIIEEYIGDINTEFSLSNVAFEEVEYAIISSANVEIVVTNNYPVKTSFTGEVYDESSNDLIVETRVEEIMPGETRTMLIPIEDKRISSELIAKTSNAKVFESEQPIIVDLDAMLLIEIDIKDIKLKEGKGITPEFEITNREFIPFKVEEDFQITEVLTNNAEFEIILSNSLPIDGNALLTFPGFTQNGTAKTISIPFKANQQNINQTISLDKHLLNFQGAGHISFNSIEVDYTLKLSKAENPITIKNTDDFSVQFQVNEFDAQYLEGSLGQKEVTLNKGVAKFPSDFWQQIEGNIYFADPIIHFLIENSIGIPNEFTVDFTGINQNSQKVSLNPPIFSVPYPSGEDTEAKKTTVTVDKNNSNILEFIAVPPDLAVEYNAFITLNPEASNSSVVNRIYPDSYIKLGYEVEIPMQFSTTGIHFSKYFNLDSVSISGLETGTLRIKYANHIPLSFAIHTSFRDSITNDVMNTLDPFTIKAAKTDAGGRATKSTVNFVDIELSKEFSQSLNGANQLYVTGTFITPKNGLEEVKLYLNDYLDLRFILDAKFDMVGGTANE